MDFTLDKKHEMARSLFREFAENEVKPLAQETDETEQFPAETVKKMAKYGFMGIPVPKEYGGQGCDPLTYVMCVEELSKVCATTGVVVSAHTSLCIDPIMTYGTEEQKHNISFIPFFFFITYKILTCVRTLISALQALRKHYRICSTTPVKLRFNHPLLCSLRQAHPPPAS